jgi:hypothetical protein
MHLNSAAALSNLKISILYLVEVLSELIQEWLIIPAPISTTSVFERIVVSGIAKNIKVQRYF